MCLWGIMVVFLHFWKVSVDKRKRICRPLAFCSDSFQLPCRHLPCRRLSDSSHHLGNLFPANYLATAELLAGGFSIEAAVKAPLANCTGQDKGGTNKETRKLVRVDGAEGQEKHMGFAFWSKRRSSTRWTQSCAVLGGRGWRLVLGFGLGALH